MLFVVSLYILLVTVGTLSPYHYVIFLLKYKSCHFCRNCLVAHYVLVFACTGMPLILAYAIRLLPVQYNTST